LTILKLEKELEELKGSETNLTTLQKQASSQSKEYERLLDEHAALQVLLLFYLFIFCKN